MKFLIVTGLSGAGKTSVLHHLEDNGYQCMDNLPPLLLGEVFQLFQNVEVSSPIALGVDSRSGNLFDADAVLSAVEQGKQLHDIGILFLEADVETLIDRYKETRRRHPLSDRLKDGLISDAVDFERALLVPVKNLADYTIETSYMSNKQLRERVMNLFMEDASQSLTLTFMSFGFKFGIPLEADLIIDVRCLPNPFYIPELKKLTGLDKAVRDYVLGSDETQEFLRRTLYMLDFSVPLYLKEGKSELVVGIGCTGGKHRSITVARELEHHFLDLGYRCVIQHRDVAK